MYAFLLNQWAIARQEMCANILKRIYLMIVDVAFSMNLFHIAYIWYLYLTRMDTFHGFFNITNNLYTRSMFLWFSHNIKNSRGYHCVRKGESRSQKYENIIAFVSCASAYRASKISKKFISKNKPLSFVPHIYIFRKWIFWTMRHDLVSTILTIPWF